MVFPSEFPSHQWSKIAPGTTGVGAGFRAGGSGRSFSGLAIGVPNDLTPHDLGWLMVKNYPCEDELFWGVVWLNEIIKIDMFLEDIKSYPPIHHLIYRRFCSNVITEPSGEGPSHFFSRKPWTCSGCHASTSSVAVSAGASALLEFWNSWDSTINTWQLNGIFLWDITGHSIANYIFFFCVWK